MSEDTQGRWDPNRDKALVYPLPSISATASLFKDVSLFLILVVGLSCLSLSHFTDGPSIVHHAWFLSALILQPRFYHI